MRKTPKKTHKLLLEVFQADPLPLSEIELRERLAKKGQRVDKTTIYRQIKHLLTANQIKPVEFGDGKKRFELNLPNHHHHLVCTNCESIEDIFVHNDVRHVEQKILKEKKFQIKTHSLEFFGLCRECQ